MANKQTECLNIECSCPVDGELWCGMECKRKFLLYYYSDGQSRMWFKESDKKFRERQKIVLKEIKESGLGISGFLKTLGDFKEDVPMKEKWTLCELHKNGDPDYPKEQCSECTFALVSGDENGK